MYLIHFAGPRFVESWKALEKLYTEDKIKVIGVANFEIDHFEQQKIMPMINQIETHPRFQQQKLREYMSQAAIGRRLDKLFYAGTYIATPSSYRSPRILAGSRKILLCLISI